MDNLIDPKTAIQTAKLLSFSSAFVAGGYCLSFSQNTFPAIYEHRPQFSARAFNQIWSSASPIVPALTLLSTSASAYLALAIPEQRRQWTTAALTMLSSASWTALVMMPGIRRLIQISEKKEVMEKSEMNLEHRQLMIRWVKQNYVSVALQFTSAFMGLRAALDA